MKHKYLTILLAMLMSMAGVAGQAQTWTAPEVPTTASDPVSGHLYRVKNVESGLFLAGGSSWYDWATSTVLVDPEITEPLTFRLENTGSNSWTFARQPDGKFTFISGATPERAEAGSGEMHVDMNGRQGHQYFELLKQNNGYYHIRVVEKDDTYGSAKVEDWADRCWGWQGEEGTFPFAVYGTVKPADGYFCDWEFIDMTSVTLEYADGKTRTDYYTNGDIPANTYSGNKDIIQVSIEGRLFSIGNNAFSNCSGLTSVTIPASVTSIGDQAFSGCI